MSSKLRPLLMALLAPAFIQAESFLDLNFGIAPSRSILGISYTEARNRFTTGVMGFWISPSRGYLLSPGVGYSRYLTDKGFYGNLSYAPVFRDEEMSALRFTGPGPNDYEIVRWRVKGWEAGLLFLGGGKTFQFTRWGIHLDAHLVTDANKNIGQAWGYSVGIGGSYRFKLD